MKSKGFWPFFFTQFLGALNHNLFKNAIVILVTFKATQLTSIEPKQMVAISGAIFILPFFLFSSLSGQLAEKFSKSDLMRKIKILELFIMGIASIGFLLPNLNLLLISLFFMGFQSTLFGPAKYSILPDLLQPDELVKGNAYVEMGTFLAILMGTIIGGIVISLDSGEYITSAAIIVLALSGIITAFQIPKLEAVNRSLKIEKNIFKATWDILKVAKEKKSVWLSVLAISWFWFLGASILSLFPVYVKDILNGNEEVVTTFLTLFCLGAAAGSILSEKLSSEKAELGLVPLGAIGMSIFLFDLYFVHIENSSIAPLGIKALINHDSSILRVMLDLFLISLFSGVFSVPLYTFIQEATPRESLSRVIAANNNLNAFFMVISSLMLMGLYSLDFSMQQIFLTLAVLNFFISFYVFYTVPEFFMRLLCMFFTKVFYSVEVKGLENIPKGSAAILTCNHVSFVDWLIISGKINRPIRYVMYYKFLKNPIFRFVCKNGRAIPIASQKEDKAIFDQAFKDVNEAAREGDLLCIFPEGVVTRDGKLNRFRLGLKKIVDDHPMPIIPMALSGLWGSFYSRKYGWALSNPMAFFQSFRRKIKLEITEAIPGEELNIKELEEFTRNLIDDSFS